MELLTFLFSETGMFLLLGGLFFFPLLVALIAVKDIFFNESLVANKKLLWVTIVILLPLFGAILYYFLGKNTYKNNQP